MTNSTQLITDITTVITNGPNPITSALANAPSGKIMDYVGNCKLLQFKLKETRRLLDAVIADTGVSDQNYATLVSIQNVLA